MRLGVGGSGPPHDRQTGKLGKWVLSRQKKKKRIQTKTARKCANARLQRCPSPRNYLFLSGLLVDLMVFLRAVDHQGDYQHIPAQNPQKKIKRAVHFRFFESSALSISDFLRQARCPFPIFWIQARCPFPIFFCVKRAVHFHLFFSSALSISRFFDSSALSMFDCFDSSALSITRRVHRRQYFFVLIFWREDTQPRIFKRVCHGGAQAPPPPKPTHPTPFPPRTAAAAPGALQESGRLL